MNYRTHVTIGLITSVGACILIPSDTFVIRQKALLCGVSLVGSLIFNVNHLGIKILEYSFLLYKRGHIH